MFAISQGAIFHLLHLLYETEALIKRVHTKYNEKRTGQKANA
jgi:hypothetical protein